MSPSDVRPWTGDVRDAASIILVRERAAGDEPLEVFLLRRHRKAGFMASSFVFPGGIADDRDGGEHRVTAARELFEEAGVLLAKPELPTETTDPWRAVVDAGDADLRGLLRARGAELATSDLHYFAHWVTPSVEKRRYSARFFVARMPPAQRATPDNQETVDAIWVTPDEALERAGELRLPPPQVRTFHEIREAAGEGWRALTALCSEREAHPFPILPRMAPNPDGGFWLLLPWDPDYMAAGHGDAHPMDPAHPLATGPSRFILAGTEGWKNVAAPTS